MPTYTMTGPGGQQFTLDAGPNVSREKAEAELRRRISAYVKQSSAPASPVTPPAKSATTTPVAAPVSAAPSAEVAKDREETLANIAKSQKLIVDYTKMLQRPTYGVDPSSIANAIDAAKQNLAIEQKRLQYMNSTGQLAPSMTVGSALSDIVSGAPRALAKAPGQIIGGLEGLVGSGLQALPGPDFGIGKALSRQGSNIEAGGNRIAETLFGKPSEATKYSPIANLLSQSSEAIGSTAPYLLTEGAAGILGNVGKAGRVAKALETGEKVAVPLTARAVRAANYPIAAGQGSQQAGQQAQEFRDQGGDVSQAQEFLARLVGAGLGLTELGVVSRMVEKLPTSARGAAIDRAANFIERATMGKVAPKVLFEGVKETIQDFEQRAVGRIALSAAEEALQEGGSQLGQNLAAREIYNPNQDVLEGVGENMLLGGIAGGALKGGVEAVNKVLGTPAQQGTNPEVITEFQRLAAIEVAKVMVTNPDLKQNEAVKFVEGIAEELLTRAAANVVAKTKGGAGDTGTTGAGLDVSGGSGGSPASTSAAPAPTGSASNLGETNAGRVGEPVSGVSVPNVGAEAGEPALTPITGAQVKAMVPTIEQAFEASALDFEDSYGVKKLNAEQKKQAARIVLQSPEVDPYDAIGSVLDRGAQLRGEKPATKKAPSTSRTETTINGVTTVQEGPTTPKAQPTPTAAETATGEKVASPSQRTMNDMAGIGTVNPDNTNEVLVEGGGLQLTPLADDVLKVDSLRAVEKGGGRKAMEQLTKVADDNGTELQLSPEPFAAEAGKEMSPTELGEWYRGFGFQEQPDGSMVRPARVAAPAATPKPTYTPQQIVDHLERFAVAEAQDRGIDPSMFREGVRDVQDGREFLPDEVILEKQGQQSLDNYKAGIQWANERITEAQAAPTGGDEDLSPAFESIKGEGRAAPAPRRAAPSVPTEAPKPSFLETLSPEEQRGWQQSKEAYEAVGVTSGKQAGYEVPDYTHSLYLEGVNSVKQGKTIPSRQQLEEAVGPYNADYFEMGVAEEQRKRLKEVIDRQPGDTVAAKIMHMAQTAFEELPKQDIIDGTTPYDPAYETIRANPGMNIARMAGMVGWQIYGDPTNMGQVCIKEVLQNSFDATRSAIANGQITQGNIEVSISSDRRTLTMKDNGIGMPPEVLGGKFLQIAGTNKEGDKNAGGFGIAKMLFLYANKDIRVVTARDGRIAELVTTGDELSKALNPEEYPDAAPDIEIRDMEPADYAAFPDGHGTIIQLTLHEEVTGGGKTFKIERLPSSAAYAPALTFSPLFSNINVEFKDQMFTYGGKETVSVGSNFPIQDYTQFVGVKFPWGIAKVYITRDQNGQTYGNNMHILSNGLWQFSTIVKKDPTNAYSSIPVPYGFYVDIVPSVKPDEYGYPFDFNRQGFTNEAQVDFAKVKNYIDAIYAYKSRSGEATTFGNIQYLDANGQLGPVIDLTPSIPIVDTAFTNVSQGDQITVGDDGSLLVNGQPMPELTADQLKTGIPSASDLKINPDLIDSNAVMMHDNADVVIASTGEKMPLPEFMRRKFGDRYDELMRYTGETFLTLRDDVARVMGYKDMLDEAVGVSTDPKYRGVSIRLPFSGSFINPLVPVYADGLRAGFGIWGTMIHEFAHHKERNHYEEFPAEMQNIELNMEADDPNYSARKREFAETMRDKYGDIIQFGVESFNGKDPDISIEFRGNRFTEGSGEQVPNGTGNGGTGDVRSPSGEGSTGESLLGPAYESRKGAGKRGQSGAGKEGTEPLTDANVEKAVSVKLSKGQIKRLEAAAGIRRMELDKMQKRIVQSRNDNETNSLIKRLVAAAHDPDANSGILASLTRSLPPPVYKFLLGFQQIEDVFRLAKVAGVRSLAKIDTIMRNEYIPYVNRIVRQAGKISEDWAEFAARDAKGNAALDDAIIYSNMIDADPSLALTAADYMRIDNKLKGLQDSLAAETDPKKRTALQRQITIRKNDIQRLYFGGEGKDAAGNPVTVVGWNSVPPDGRRIFKAARDFHRANFNEHYRLLMQRIDDAKFDSNDAVKLKSSIEQMFAKARERTIYFPVKRFGEYWLSVGASGSDFYMRETAAELNALKRRLKKEGETREITMGYSRETLRNKIASNDASAALKGILDILDGGNKTNANGVAKIEDVEDLRDLIFQMYLTSLPEADMRRRFVHREFKTGFDTDALRSFASTAVASANQLGRLAYNYKFQNAIEDAKKETEGNDMKPWLDTLTLEVKDRVDNIMSPDTNNIFDTLIAFGSKVAFYFHLSGASSAMVNFTQLHILGLPVLSGEFGEAKTAAMAARYTTSFLVGREIPNPFRDKEGNVALQAPDFKFQNSAYMRSLKKSDPERYQQTLDAWEYAQDHDVIESTFSSNAELYQRSNTPTGDFNFRQAVRRGKGLTAAQRAAGNTMNAMGFMFHKSETIGRSVMYMSSFDLAYERAIKQGKTAEQAGREARELAVSLTNKAMFDFSNWNKSRFAKQRSTRLALQMTSYIQSMNSLMFRSILGMIPYYNKEGKAAAARVLFGSAAITMLYGGLAASQFYAWGWAGYTLIKFIESMFGDDDEEEEAKQKYLNEKTIEKELLKYADEHGNELGKKDMEYFIRSTWIPETFGQGSTLANALGLSDKAAANLATAADMGIPGVFGVDISKSVALGDLWSPVQVKGDTPEVRAYEATARVALGPFGSAATSLIKAADAYNNGDIQQAIELSVPAIVRNPIKANRLEKEGLRIGKDKDIQLKDPSYYTPAKVILQSLGLKDAQTSRNMQLDIMAGDIEKEVAAEKTKLLDQRYRAITAFEQNPSKENELKWNRADRAIDVYNLNYPSNEITLDTKQKSLKNKRSDAADKAYGLGINKNIPVRESLEDERVNQLLEEEQ